LKSELGDVGNMKKGKKIVKIISAVFHVPYLRAILTLRYIVELQF
jgi:hypothetical protein